MATIPMTSEAMRIGEAVYRPGLRTIERDGREERLEPRLANLLDTLIEGAGETQRRGELLDRVWDEEGSDEALTQAVSRLRQLLGSREIIRTMPREGYCLMASPTALDERPVREPEPEALPMAAPAPDRSTGSKPWLISLAGMVAGAVLAALLYLAFGPRPVTILEEVTTPPIQGAEPQRRTVQCDGTPEECGLENVVTR